ncbi:uncharacterized protein C8Q71DRAFT_911760 [Rhodofomes roseus]|uniref:F-box domain-containing protein n=1 Tax=Rhodofomes roseus TaxID=34475 RepID=A0ABQ8K0T5_9APHY|nr:uncharacterized protein C8Q71DRAFT_911760 [Rhodofomes roseus]KAH9829709.1 hypothetical protein C8Q71DRAFT_911760 [Rhodofomes roseus]
MGRHEETSNAYSGPTQPMLDSTHTSRAKSRTVINDLPPDVFLIIFRMLSGRPPRSTPIRWSDWIGWERMQPHTWPEYHLLNPEYPFPDYLASVCRLWRAVLSSVSKFWKRLIIRIGKDATSLSKIGDSLVWSQNRPIDIYIMRTFDPRVEDPTERAQVMAVMEVLKPHMKRWRTLWIKVLCSSSLPLPRVDLIGQADVLRELTLDFVIDDSVASDGAASPLVGAFHTPALDKLFMSGLHFRELFVKPFPQSPLPPALSELTVAEYDSTRHPPFSLFDLLSCLVTGHRRLGSMVLANLDLDHSYSGPSILSSHVSWYADVGFFDMSGDVIAEYHRLLRSPWAESAYYTLWLSPLARLLIGVHGRTSSRHACLRQCDGLSPAVLLLLAVTILPGDNWILPDLRGLTIEGCTGFQSPDLRLFLEHRRRAHAVTGFAEDGDLEYVMSSVKYLHVQDCCELAPADKEWLDENLDEVHWDDWSGGTGASVWIC